MHCQFITRATATVGYVGTSSSGNFLPDTSCNSKMMQDFPAQVKADSISADLKVGFRSPSLSGSGIVASTSET